VQFNRVCIFGVGLLGGSIGLALRSVSPGTRIAGFGHRAKTLDAALRTGAIDESFADPADAARGADLLILCTPVGTFQDLLRRAAAALSSSCILTDVGSTKRSAVGFAESILGDTAGRFVASHPMAGSEKRGIEFARADLFQGARCITTPTARTDPLVLARVESFWESLGMQVMRLSPENHDRLVCDISHLPHAVAAALVSMQPDRALPLAGKGFLDTTRVAGGDGGLWRDILLDNRDNLSDSILRLRGQLDALLELLAADDRDRVKTWLDAAAARRAGLLAGKSKEMNPE
jgi:prephenate dehydrogenase